MTAAASPFAQARAELSPLGFTLLPALPAHLDRPGAGKAPGHYVSGGWSGLSGWSRFLQTAPSTFQQTVWERMDGANAGFLAGTPAGFDVDGAPLKLVALDFDCRDPDGLALLLASAPASPAEKRGHVGLTRLFRASRDLASRAYDGRSGRLIDLLCDGRFCVIPPSIHPKSGRPYTWTRGPVPVSELPVLTSGDIEKLEEALALVGWEREAETARPTPGPRVVRVRGDYADDWAETNGEALARLDEWFALLNLPGTRRAGPGVFRAIPIWRPSGGGRPTEIRKPNLSASSGLGAVPAGIRDFGASGADASLTAIDVVQRALDLSAVEAMTWLRETLGLDEDNGVVIDLGHQAKSETAPAPVGAGTEAAQVVPGEAGATVAEPNIGATHGAAEEVPPHLLQVPGLLGEIAEWVVASARRPNRAFALAAALLVVGTAAGRKIAGPTGSGTHLYVLALADSGSGKDHALNAIATLLSAAGMERHIGKGEFMSHQALFSDLMQEPLTLCPMDEFGSFLRKINNRNGSGSEKAITGVLRTAWGKSFSTMPSPGWATKTSRPIHSPALSLMGAATDKDFYTAIDGADLDNGFLNRFLLVATKARPPSVEPVVSRHEVPEAISQALLDIYNVAGPLERATMHGQGAGAPLLTVGWSTPHVKGAFLDFENRIIERAAKQPMLARVSEMAIRLATIRALGMQGVDDPVVCMDDLEWAMEFATWSAERLIADANEHMAENQTQRDRAKIQRLIRAAGRLTQRDLVRKTSGLKAREVEEITRLLETAELIRIETGPKASNGKASKIYVWIGE